jgi:hypothetical protein
MEFHKQMTEIQENVPPQQKNLPHSVIGFFSFAFAIISLVFLGGILATMFYIEFIDPDSGKKGGALDCLDPFTSVIGVLSFFSFLGNIPAAWLAFVFAIGGLCHLHTRRMFALWGLFLSTISLIFWVCIVIGARAGW